MLYRVMHTTTYAYSDPVSLCHNVLHLTARGSAQQTCHRTRLLISPVPAVSTASVDFFGNITTFFTVQEPHQRLRVTAINITEVSPPILPEPNRTAPWEHVREQLRSERSPELLQAYQFAFDSPYIAGDHQLRDYALPSFPAGRPILEAVLDLTARIHLDFTYDPKATTIATPLQEVMRLRRGVCQDFAHLEIGCLRALGLAARYVSGYLLTRPPPGQPRLQGADASHAWLSVYSPGHGWIDLDPTNNLIPSDQHVLLAWGRDYDDVSPIKGVILGGGTHTVTVGVDVQEVTALHAAEV